MIAIMNISRKKILILIALLVIIVVAAGGVTIILDKLHHLDSYKAQILTEVEKALNRRVLYDRGEFSLQFGPSFTFTKVIVKEKDGSTNFIAAERLTFKIALLPLLEKKLSFKGIVLDRPDIALSRDSKGVYSISDLLETKKTDVSLQLKGIRLKKGIIRFRDMAISAAGVATTLEDVDLSVSNMTRGKECDVKLAAVLGGGNKKSSFSLAGTAKLAKKDKPLSETSLKAKIVAKSLDVAPFWPYYSSYVPFQKILGRFDMDSTFNGSFSSFTSKGELRVAGLRFSYPQVFHAVLTPRDVHLHYAMELTKQDVSVKSLNLTIDGLNVKGSCAVRDIHSGDPRIVAQATTSQFRLEDFGKYIPYGIIVKDTADFIEQHIKGGTYRLDDGRLDGRISQILHMELGQNYNILFIKGRVERGLVSFGPQVPSFNTIKGKLEMRGKDFNLLHMSGNFGSSPFTLEGKITDYPLNTPSSYPFTMKMTPRQGEVAWLLGRERGQKLAFNGDSALNLSGTGFTSGYNLSGDWNLTSAAYSFPDLISKPAGRNNTISFKGSINKLEARVSACLYSLPPMMLAASADYRFTGKNLLDLGIKTNLFPVNEIAPMLPRIRQYQPSGRIQAAVNGTGSGADLVNLSWGGDVSFSGFSCKPSASVKTVSNMTGTIHFKGDSLETSQLSARLGDSTIYGKGSMTGFKNPTLNLAFSSPSLAMSDLGLHAPQKEVKVEKLQGNISLKDNNLLIKSLSGQINNSRITLNGTVMDVENPKIDIAVTAPHLEIDDILLLTQLEQGGAKGKPPAGIRLKASIQANSGKYKDIEFAHLKTVAMLEEKILYLQPLELSAFGGHVSGKGRFDFGSNGSPRYQVSFNLDKVSAEKVAHAVGIKKQEIIGELSMEGELTAKGKTGADIKQTALGSVKFTIEDGSLRRFATLSKIFSLLNVSQLLKLQLPDMVSGGMPFNAITGSIAIRDGIVSSDDLFVDSDAMNISAVGKLDMVKEELDATIGVQPLQTVDRVVSRIPIVGWILTGKDRTLITAYFEAKGKVDDPKVSAIPVKSMAKGVFDIFKRVFELPGKLFTDTGEVIIGK